MHDFPVVSQGPGSTGVPCVVPPWLNNRSCWICTPKCPDYANVYGRFSFLNCFLPSLICTHPPCDATAHVVVCTLIGGDQIARWTHRPAHLGSEYRLACTVNAPWASVRHRNQGSTWEGTRHTLWHGCVAPGHCPCSCLAAASHELWHSFEPLQVHDIPMGKGGAGDQTGHLSGWRWIRVLGKVTQGAKPTPGKRYHSA